jgi:hypothetical protein
LAQTLALSLNESPFYANYGIPARDSVATQVPPDMYVAITQSQYAPYFASLVVQPDFNDITPTYVIKAVFLDGTVFNADLAT